MSRKYYIVVKSIRGYVLVCSIGFESVEAARSWARVHVVGDKSYRIARSTPGYVGHGFKNFSDRDLVA